MDPIRKTSSKGTTAISAYRDLSDEDKLEEAIRFVARGVDLPTELAHFLCEQGLYEAIVSPSETHGQSTDGEPAPYKSGTA
ncbi:hypothetical protein [Rhizobium phage RHph_X3_9]|nr:hypothetical protein [Rhizobium phage RHph_X3_9]